MKVVDKVRLMEWCHICCLQYGWNVLILASANGKEDMVKYLCNQCRINPFVKSNNVR